VSKHKSHKNPSIQYSLSSTKHTLLSEPKSLTVRYIQSTNQKKKDEPTTQPVFMPNLVGKSTGTHPI